MASKNLKYQDVLTRDEVLAIIQRKLGHSGFELVEYTIRPISDNPMGFLGVHLNLNASITNGGVAERHKFFTKKMPTEVPTHLQYALETKAYYKEVEMFKTVFVDFKNSQKNGPGQLCWLPKFYYAKETEILVFEDLMQLGYKMLPEREYMDDDHILASLISMAKMHAASFIFEEKFYRKEVKTLSPEYVAPAGDHKMTMGEIYPHLIYETESSDQKGHIGNTFCEVGIKSELVLIDLLEDYSAEEKKKIKEALPDKMRIHMALVKPSDRYKNIFLHGDLWSNNLMFRYNEQGKPEPAIIVDFQLARFGPPAKDLIMFLYFNLSTPEREAHEERYLKFYFDELRKELLIYDLDINVLLPWATFKESYEFHREFALVTCLFYFQLILLPGEISAKFLASPELFNQTMLQDRREMIRECFLTDKLVRDRVTDMLHQTIRGYIL